MTEAWPVAIIGGGPAGLAAAIQLKRYGIATLLLEKEALGGLLRNANLVENYPGFPGGIKGHELIELFTQQAKETSVKVTYDVVRKLDWRGGAFSLLSQDREYQARVVVVASGTKPLKFRRLKIPSNLEKLVYYEVHPLLAKEKVKVTIVGAGDAAFDYALNLSKGNKVTILNRSAKAKCLPLLWDRVKAESNVHYFDRTKVSKIVPEQKGGMLLETESPQGETTIQTDFLIGALGRIPQLDFLSDGIKAKLAMLQSTGKIYLVGDVKNDIYRQTSIAVGDGVRAAMQIYRLEQGIVE